jgi:Putative Ig domain
MMLIPAGDAASPPQPHRPRVGPNLVANPNMNGTANWLLTGGAQYVTNLSRTADGSGAVRLPPGGRLDSRVIAVTPGKSYTLAAYMRSGGWPPGNIDLAFSVNDAAGGYIRYGGEAGASGNSKANTWEEVAMTVTPDATTNYITVILGRIYPDAGAADIWIDEVYFGEGIGFQQPPSTKTPFNGASVRVDDLGNYSLFKGGTWQPFFPLCIYADGRRPNWAQVYSNQGFNCNMWGDDTTIRQVKDAVSPFNSDGMMSSIQITHFMGEGGWAYNRADILTNMINNIKNAGLIDYVLHYYFDNENNWTEWAVPEAMATLTKQLDVNASGQRLHPIYILQGSYNAARMNRDAGGVPWAEVIGTYISGVNTGGAGSPGGITIVQNIEGQTQPVTFAQMNIVWRGTGVGAFRAYLYTYITKGARGAGFWRDLYIPDPTAPATRVDQTDWWPDVPNVRREIDQMLPLIRQPHWTNWKAAYNASLPLSVGTRDYQGQGYLIVANNSSSAVTVTFTLTGLPYTPQRVVDYFSGNTVAAVSGNAFTVTLPALGLARGTAVYQLAGSTTTAPVINSPASAVGTVGSPFTYQITATNGPTSYDAAPLPAGLAVDTASGLISGTPPAAGTSNVTLSASNNAGTGTATLSLSFGRIKHR